MTTSQIPSYVAESDGVLTLTVSTEAAGTSLAPGALIEGAQALQEVANGSRSVGAVLLVGRGANFCAGGDVRAFASAQDRPTHIRSLADAFHSLVMALNAARCPVVAAVKGWAAGAGMSLVLHSDIAIGGPSTHLRPAYPGIGLTPDGGLTWTLPRAIGAARARRIILTDEAIDATTAVDLGLLSTIVDDACVDAIALDEAQKLAAGPREALQATRALLNYPSMTLEEHLEREGESISRMAGRPDGIEGVDAFVARRNPRFTKGLAGGRP